jgi:hypothetical protein
VRGDVVAQLYKGRVVFPPLPTDQAHGLASTEFEGQLDRIDRYGREDVAFCGDCGFVLNPFRRHRIFGPQHDDTSCRFELLLYGLVERLSGKDLPIPPHGPTTSFQSVRQLTGSLSILSRVAEEYVVDVVCHGRSSTHRELQRMNSQERRREELNWRFFGKPLDSAAHEQEDYFSDTAG